jgi:hypothetical protein
MSDFLSNLAARALAEVPVIQPRLPSRFEPDTEGGARSDFALFQRVEDRPAEDSASTAAARADGVAAPNFGLERNGTDAPELKGSFASSTPVSSTAAARADGVAAPNFGSERNGTDAPELKGSFASSTPVHPGVPLRQEARADPMTTVALLTIGSGPALGDDLPVSLTPNFREAAGAWSSSQPLDVPGSNVAASHPVMPRRMNLGPIRPADLDFWRAEPLINHVRRIDGRSSANPVPLSASQLEPSPVTSAQTIARPRRLVNRPPTPTVPLLPESVVQVTIGSIEVRAVPPTTSSSRPRRPTTTLGLSEYLRLREQRK